MVRSPSSSFGWRSALVVLAVTALGACGGTTTKTDAGTGGSATGGGTGGSATGGGTGGSATGGGTGGSATGGGTGGSATGGGTGGGAGCSAQYVPVVLDAGCANALLSPGACGGDPSGNWCYSSYCLDPSSLGNVSSICSSAYFKSVAAQMKGSAQFAGNATTGVVSREFTMNVDVVVDTPPSCLSYGGYFTLTCADMGSLFQLGGYDAGCAASADGGCLCGITQTFSDSSTGAYTASGGNLTVGDGGTYEYCVQGNALTYRKTAPAKSEPGVGFMAK